MDQTFQVKVDTPSRVLTISDITKALERYLDAEGVLYENLVQVMEVPLLKAHPSREQAWDLLIDLKYRHHRFPGCTTVRLNRIKSEILQDDEFWSDILERHNLSRGPSDHCLGNFYGMLAQSFTQKGWL